MIEKYTKPQYIWPYWEGGNLYRPMLYILERSRQADVKFELTCNSATYNFRDIHG